MPKHQTTPTTSTNSKITSSSIILSVVRKLFKLISSLFSLKTKDYKLKTNFGFTLVELIVVIVILGILATIAFLSFSNQSGSARDGVRLSDINSIKKSMEMYSTVGGAGYPIPDNSVNVTYLGGVIWMQGTFGDNAYKVLSKNLSKKVVDPLSSSEYIYSLTANKREYQLKANFENKVSFDYNDSSNIERNSNDSRIVMDYDSSYNSNDSNDSRIVMDYNDSSSNNSKYISSFLSFFSSESNLSTNNHAYADTTSNGTSCYIKGNYNGVMEKISTGTSTVTNYIVALPGIITSATGTNIDYTTIGSGKLLCTGMNNPCSITFTPTVAYSGTSLPSSDTEINSMMVKLQDAYTGSNIKNVEVIDTLLKSSGSTLTDLGKISIKSVGGSVVSVVDNNIFSAVGGTITYSGGYIIHTFISNGTFTPNKSGNIEILVVAGGGAGGGYGGGGGGAGGLIYNSSYLVASQNYNIIIGNGGTTSSSNGEDSRFDNLIAIGGGGGASWSGTQSNGKDGGSGGGAPNDGTIVQYAGTGITNQGNKGGDGSITVPYPSGGGGGAGATGGKGSGSQSGAGGNGLAYNISGISTYYAGGGGGGASVQGAARGLGGLGGGGNGGSSGSNGNNGTQNTGGGGGGSYAGASYNGGSGGSGIVIIRYLSN